MKHIPAKNSAKNAAAVSLTLDPGQWLEGLVVHEHPSVGEIHQENLSWTRRFELVKGELEAHKHAKIGCASFAAHTYADADRELVRLGADLITWLYLFDDAFGEGTEADTAETMQARFADYVTLLRSGRLPEGAGPFHHALLDLRARALRRADQAWLERFARSMDEYFRGCVRELPYRRAVQSPDIGEYRDLRALSIGAYPVFTLVELATGLITDEEACLPEVRELRERGALLCAWVNDAYSYRKEKADQEPLNLVSVLKREFGLDEAESFAAAIEVFNTERAVFVSRCEQLEAPHSPHLLAYVRGIWGWVEGNTAWTGSCGRYAHKISS